MTQRRHEIPTHLNVEDKAFFGLTVRQVMHLTIGFAGAYAAWSQWPDLPAAIRLGLAGAGLLQSILLALVRPGGRGLEEWIFVALHYVALPKGSVWRPREPERADWRLSSGGWEAWAPKLAWKEERP